MGMATICSVSVGIGMRRRRARTFRTAAVLIAVALVALSAPAAAQAASYRSCALSERDQYPSDGIPTYNLALKRIGVTCSTAKKVMRAFHDCRPKAGYRCTRTLLGHWRCTGSKDSATALLFYATFTCKHGARRVKSSYQQNL